MKADNVEQLLEIVKAVQNGEEPGDALRRREAEPAFDGENAGREKIEKLDQKIERDSRADAREWNQDIEALSHRTIGKLRQKAGDGDWEEDDFERNLEEDAQKDFNFQPLHRAFGMGAEKISGLFEALRKKEGKLARVSGGQQREAAQEHDPDIAEEPKKTGLREANDESEAGETSGRPEGSKSGEDSGKQSDDQPRQTKDSEDVESSAESSITRQAEPLRGRESATSVKAAIQKFSDHLSQKGIRRKELFMIGAGVVLIILIAILVVNGINASMEEQKKSEHVTADAGLTVTIEQEPDTWCASYPVVLRVRAKGREISLVTIGGKDYVPDEQGQITVEAANYLLEAVVMTEQGELRAQIEIPMIDAQAPVVNIVREDSKITVAAADARSPIKEIWYAAVADNAYFDIPLYQRYREPVAYEDNTTYYFYATDAAGNRSSVTVTTTQAAKSLEVAPESLSLFPGETGYLQLQENPEGALLNNLRFESADSGIVTVDGKGAVTAVGEGRTAVRVSADGLPDASCDVEVSGQRTVTISAIGDCTLGSDESFNTATDFNAFDAVNGHSYFFQNVREILENDDVTIANLEGTLTTETAREGKQYAFKGDPSYTEILKNGSVEAVTLANNHSSDYGAKSLSDTKQYLREAAIDYCIGDEIAMRDINGIKTAFIGIYVLNDGMARENQVRETIAAAKAHGAKLIITSFHWGSEKATQPDEIQVALAHTAIDCGADLVVGHHLHVLQGIENYNGKYIVYSLGNFCFGGNSAPSDMDTIIFRQTFTVGQDGVLPGGEIEIIPCKISSAEGYNNYQPTPAQGAEAERIVGRLNEYSSTYGQTFSASGGLG